MLDLVVAEDRSLRVPQVPVSQNLIRTNGSSKGGIAIELGPVYESLVTLKGDHVLACLDVPYPSC